PNHDLQLEHAGIALLPQFGDQVEIVVVDPLAQKRRRYGEPYQATGGLRDLHSTEPARIDVVAKPGLELRFYALEIGLGPARRRHTLPLLDLVCWNKRGRFGPLCNAALHLS